MGEVRQIKFHKLHHRSIRVLLALALCMALPGFAASNSMPQLSVHASLSSPAYPIVVRGSEIPSLLGTSTTKIRAIVRHGAMLEAIPFQIDKRDSQGRYELSSNAMGTLLDANDECVFMSADAGERIALLPEPYTQQPVTELAIVDPHSGEQKWIYLIETKAAQSPPSANTLYVVYDATKDVIETGIYRIGFSSALPFLINSMQWHIDGPKKWSPNLVDTMKIRHHGKLFGNIDFARTQDDYRSRLVAVKEGPVRIIRRTLNTVRIFGYLQSPSLTIDFLAYRNGFQMDTTVDLPFRLNWFVSGDA